MWRGAVRVASVIFEGIGAFVGVGSLHESVFFSS